MGHFTIYNCVPTLGILRVICEDLPAHLWENFFSAIVIPFQKHIFQGIEPVPLVFNKIQIHQMCSNIFHFIQTFYSTPRFSGPRGPWGECAANSKAITHSHHDRCLSPDECAFLPPLYKVIRREQTRTTVRFGIEAADREMAP